MSLDVILDAQRRWATSRRLQTARDYTNSLEANLFRSLNPATRAEFAAGSGNELGLSGRPGKMQSLRSSSALAVNVFDYWRGAALLPLAQAFGVREGLVELHFEQKYPHGLPSTPPNLDVVLYQSAGAPVAIESKFAEPYEHNSDFEPLDDKYFPDSVDRWDSLGLPRCQAVARGLGHSIRFQRLNAGQLLKHVLGLAHVHRDFRPVTLAYVWYDVGTDEAGQHRAEIERFQDLVSDEVRFIPMTYNGLFETIRTAASSDYVTYLGERYFGP